MRSECRVPSISLRTSRTEVASERTAPVQKWQPSVRKRHLTVVTCSPGGGGHRGKTGSGAVPFDHLPGPRQNREGRRQSSPGKYRTRCRFRSSSRAGRPGKILSGSYGYCRGSRSPAAGSSGPIGRTHPGTEISLLCPGTFLVPPCSSKCGIIPSPPEGRYERPCLELAAAGNGPVTQGVDSPRNAFLVPLHDKGEPIPHRNLVTERVHLGKLDKPVSTCRRGKGRGSGKNAFRARCSRTEESFPTE